MEPRPYSLLLILTLNGLEQMLKLRRTLSEAIVFYERQISAGASIPPKELGTILPQDRRPPAGFRSRAPVRSWAKPVETVENL